MADEKLLKIRSNVKKRKPTYKRVQSHQFARLNDNKWRRPKGMGNKVRRGRRGKPSMPTVGYGSPKAVKGLNKFGFEEVIVFNKEDLSSIDAKTQTVVISKTVGARKRLEILNAAKEKKLSVSNFKNIDDAIKALTKEKKEKKPVKADKKTEKKTETAKKEAKKEDKKEA